MGILSDIASIFNGKKKKSKEQHLFVVQKAFSAKVSECRFNLQKTDEQFIDYEIGVWEILNKAQEFMMGQSGWEYVDLGDGTLDKKYVSDGSEFDFELAKSELKHAVMIDDFTAPDYKVMASYGNTICVRVFNRRTEVEPTKTQEV